MRKLILIIAVIAICFSSKAQTTLSGSKLTDNWSVTLNGGGVTPLKNYAFWKNMKGVMGVDVTKQVTPILGIGIEGMWAIGATESPTMFDVSNVSILGKLNLMNLFGGYKGTPRCFEVLAVLGTGWMHWYGDGFAANVWSTKLGLNLNFNLGAAKAWTVGVKPAIVFNMDGDAKRVGNSRFSSNYGCVELVAGITYHFKNSNGAHHFTLAKLYNQSEIDDLNASVNALRNNLGKKSNELNIANDTISALKNTLTAERNKKPSVQTQTVIKTNSTTTLESVVTFGQGKTSVSASQLPNVERIASYMKSHKDATVNILGYASPEGSAEVNTKIANARANAVKDMLIKKYKIDANRITAQGAGVGNMFSEPDWNRVSICTLDETK